MPQSRICDSSCSKMLDSAGLHLDVAAQSAKRTTDLDLLQALG